MSSSESIVQAIPLLLGDVNVFVAVAVQQYLPVIIPQDLKAKTVTFLKRDSGKPLIPFSQAFGNKNLHNISINSLTFENIFIT